MAKSPSLREVVTTLLALAEGEGTDAQELEEFLGVHASRLEQALQTRADALLALTKRAPGARAKALYELVRQSREREQTAQESAARNLSQAAATMLALSAAWDDDTVDLDPRIVLGRNLVSDRTRKFIRFDVEGGSPLTVRREKLVEAGKVLKFPDVICSVTRHGLRFSWRAGKGGLVLIDQPVEARHRDAVLTVVIARPRAELTSPAQAHPRARRSSWFGEVLGDLTSL